MKIYTQLYRDAYMDSYSGWSEKPDDTPESEKLLLKMIMKKYNISDLDLQNINKVKSKLRDANIDEIIKN